MSYEFNTKDEDLALPNPYKFESAFLLFTSLILFCGGVSVIMSARTFIQDGEIKVGTAATFLALLMFATAAKFCIQALSQMRFYYGRQFPSGLADQLQIGQIGKSQSAKAIMETMRQQAIGFAEPSGPLSGVLYSLCRRLITCPPQIQAAAVQHFHSLIGMVALLGSLCVSLYVFKGSEHEGMISWIYLPLTGISLITPFIQKNFSLVQLDSSSKTLWSLLGLVAFAIIGPVLVPQYVPAYPIPPMWVVPSLVLVCSMTASLLFLLSLFAKVDDVTQTNVSCEQTTIAMNCLPSQLWAEIDREFRRSWTRGIPNRIYANVPPEVAAAERGSFHGHVLEETHPLPHGHMTCSSLKDAWREKHARYLILLSMWGTILASVAVGVAIRFVADFAGMSRMEISRVLLAVIALGAANVLSFKIGHLLWSRMYFKSRLIWIEVSGTFQTSTLNIGNALTGKVQSHSTLTRVEDATLRVWVTDIVSVIFGKESERRIMALAPAEGFSKAMASHLIEFAQSQSTIVTPTSDQDLSKARTISSLDVSLQANGAGTSKKAIG
jgi:hypothetical protein